MASRPGAGIWRARGAVSEAPGVPTCPYLSLPRHYLSQQVVTAVNPVYGRVFLCQGGGVTTCPYLFRI